MNQRVVRSRPDGTMSVRVRVHAGLCEAWGNCHRWAPEVYPLDDTGHVDVHLLEVPAELAVAAWMGAESCPVGVITVLSGTSVDVCSSVSTEPNSLTGGAR